MRNLPSLSFWRFPPILLLAVVIVSTACAAAADGAFGSKADRSGMEETQEGLQREGSVVGRQAVQQQQQTDGAAGEEEKGQQQQQHQSNDGERKQQESPEQPQLSRTDRHTELPSSAAYGRGSCVFDAAADPLAEGPFSVSHIRISKEDRGNGDIPAPPKDVIIFAPSWPSDATAAERNASSPVVFFQHGFNLHVPSYSQLLSRIASHGFAVVAPQLDFTMSTNATAELANAAAVITWMAANLALVLSSQRATLLPPDLSRFCLAGHSRGGKAAFALALGLDVPQGTFAKDGGGATTPVVGAEKQTAVQQGSSAPVVRGVIGFDPVEGTTPTVLRPENNSVTVDVPVLLLGAGLGPMWKWGVIPPCAPAKTGHRAFFTCLASAAYHFTARRYGHMDFLDDDVNRRDDAVFCALCRCGESRQPMRDFSAGMAVAFLRAFVAGESEGEFRALLRVPRGLPAEDVEVEWQDVPQVAAATV